MGSEETDRLNTQIDQTTETISILNERKQKVSAKIDGVKHLQSALQQEKPKIKVKPGTKAPDTRPMIEQTNYSKLGDITNVICESMFGKAKMNEFFLIER